MDRQPFTIPISDDHLPHWRCPVCKLGVLQLHENDFSKYETVKSIKRQKHIRSSYEDIELVFHASLRCSLKSCGEVVSCLGNGYVEYIPVDWSDDDGAIYGYEEYFMPRLFIPFLNIFNIPPKTPTKIKSEIEKSFEVYFADHGASANHIRSSIEYLLDELKVPRYSIKKQKRNRISLHDRIVKLKSRSIKKYADISDTLLAIKWIGNYGSHSGDELSSNDVLDAYEMLESLLNKLYAPHILSVEQLVKRTIKHSGPPRTKTKPF